MKTALAKTLVQVLLVCILNGFTETGRADIAVVAWGDNPFGQTTVPPMSTQPVAIAGGGNFSLALLDDGTVIGWGENGLGQVNVPGGLSQVVAIAAGWNHALALRENGTVVGWGQNNWGQAGAPADLHDAIAIAAGETHSIALRRDGTVVGWGNTVAPNITDVIAIAAGGYHNLALKRDGTVVEWGKGLNVSLTPPVSVAAIAAGYAHSLALKTDGTVVSWGGGTVPEGLSDVVAIAAGYPHSLALTANGTVIAWGGQTNVPLGLSNVAVIAAGGFHNLAGVGDGLPFILSSPITQGSLTGTTVVFQVRAAGSSPLSYQWRKDGADMPMQTNSILTLNNVQFEDAGVFNAVVSNSFGAVTSQVARLRVVEFGAPDIRSDGELLVEDVIRGNQSTISMSTVLPNGTMFYTTDGSEPSFSSKPYQGPFVITTTTTIRAIVYSVDFTQSAQDGPFEIKIVPAYRLTTTVTGGGALFPPSFPSYFSGTTVTLQAYPSPGSRFVRWQGDACGFMTTADVVMDTNKVVTAIFEPLPIFPLTVSTDGGGTVSSSSPYYEGTPPSRYVTLTAQAAPGWEFLRWQADAEGNDPSLIVTTDRPKIIQAIFATSLQTTVAGPGTLTLKPGPGHRPYASITRITAKPNVGSYFAVWGSAASGSANPLEFVVMNPNPIISALFAPLGANERNVYLNVEGEGSVALAPYQTKYAAGTPVTLTAKPDAGWRFVQWQGDATGTSTNATVVLDINRSVTAVFEELPSHALLVTTAGGGYVQLNAYDPYIIEGKQVNLWARPFSGWTFLGWQGDASGSNPNLTITMDGPKSIQAVFGIPSISLNLLGPGSVTLDPPQGPYAYGSTVRLTAVPNAGAFFAVWGNMASGAAEVLDYVVTDSNPWICALFAPIPVNDVALQVQTDGQGSVEVSPNLPHYTPGTLVSLTATPASGWRFIRWQDNAGGNANPLTLTMDHNRTVTAYFAKIPIITQQPQSTTNLAGSNVTFSVVVDGTDPLNYQWAFNGTNIPGATGAALALSNVKTNNEGLYTVAVTNLAGGTVSEPAKLTVLVPAQIVTQPQSQVGYWGKNIAYELITKGTLPLSYSWYKDGIPISWATDATLTLTNLELTAGGDYWVQVCNSINCVTSVVAHLVVNPAGISLGLYPGLTIDGVVGKTYGIQSTTNLTDPILWSPLTNLTLSDPIELWIDRSVDTTSQQNPKRFYRVVPVP